MQTKDDKKAGGTDASPARPQRPYEPPKIRPLGAVRELTLGSTGGFGDAVIGHFKPTRG
jgi:hypothetical protein